MFPQKRLLEIFANRPDRFALIEQGMKALNVRPGEQWIEIGCNTGDAAAYMKDKHQLDAFGIDCDGQAIEMGKAKHLGIKLLCAEAQDMPFDDKSIDGILSEAAWSPLTDKDVALREYLRVIKPGGHMIINDFILRPSMGPAACEGYRHIPCFAGVDTLAAYCHRFAEAGFECLQATKETNTLFSLTFHLMKECNVKADEIGTLLSCRGKDETGSCDVIVNAGLDFGQLLLRKR